MAKRLRNLRQIPQFGNNVSHANNRTPRRFNPNLQSIRVALPQGGAQTHEGLHHLHQGWKNCEGCLR